MSWFGKKPRGDVGNVGGFGKVPALGDFVRTPSPCEEMIAFETWLTTAMETAEVRVGVELKARFASVPAHAFVWSGALDKKMRGIFAGVIGTSHDAVGRRFPIVIGAPMPLAVMVANPHLAPLVLVDFFVEALEALDLARSAKTAADFHTLVTAIAKPSVDGVVGTAAQYTTWAKTQPADRVAKSALAMVVEACAPYRGQDLAPSTLGIRVPIGHPNDAAMWLDLVRSAAAWKVTMPTFFMPLAGTDRRALIQLGAEAPPSVLADLYVPSADSDTVCDVTTDGVPPSLRPELADAETIADLTASLRAP